MMKEFKHKKKYPNFIFLKRPNYLSLSKTKSYQLLNMFINGILKSMGI